MLYFRDLQDRLRRLLWGGVLESGELTETALAEKTGFRQAHISNFLHRKRGLSLRATDDVLRAEELSCARSRAGGKTARAARPASCDGR